MYGKINNSVFRDVNREDFSFLLSIKDKTVLCCDSCSLFLHSVVDYFDVCFPQDFYSLLTLLSVGV